MCESTARRRLAHVREIPPWLHHARHNSHSSRLRYAGGVMRSDYILVTHPDGRQQELPLAAGHLRIGSALDNDLIISGPWIAPHHATIRCDDQAGLTIEIGASVTIELPPSAVPRLSARIGGSVLSYRTEVDRTTQPLSLEGLPPGFADDWRDTPPEPDRAALLHTLLAQRAAPNPRPADPHDAITSELPALQV